MLPEAVGLRSPPPVTAPWFARRVAGLGFAHRVAGLGFAHRVAGLGFARRVAGLEGT